jgi:hypothetical protein
MPTKLTPSGLVEMSAQEAADFAAMQAAASAPVPIRRITSSAFVQRFTPAEYAAQIADPVLAQAAAAAGYQVWVNLDSAKMAQLLAYAVSKGYLAANRVGTGAGQLLCDGTTAEATL